MSLKSYALVSEDEARWNDAQEITVRCLHCPEWSYTGPASAARGRSAAHRTLRHPELAPRKRAPRVRPVERLPRDLTPRVRKPAGRARFRWTHEMALKPLRAFALEHGRPPLYKEATTSAGFPAHPVMERLYGSFSAYIAAGGFPRPSRGRPRLVAA